jgi:hypothetical protein
MEPLAAQLAQLTADLHRLVDGDAEQEVEQPALGLIDAVLAEAKERLPMQNSLREHLIDLISPEMIEMGKPLRAAEALVIVGQISAAVTAFAESDRGRYDGVVALLPVRAYPMSLLAGWDWGASFLWSGLQPLVDFVQEWGGADRRFHDPKLDAARDALHRSAYEFMDFVNHNNVGANVEWGCLVRAENRDTFRIDSGAVDDRAVVDGANALASACHDDYLRFIELGRVQLGV